MSTDGFPTQFPTFQRKLKSFLLRLAASAQDAEAHAQVVRFLAE